MQKLLTSDEQISTLRTEMEREYDVVSTEVAKIYKQEKDKLQETIEELEMELKVCRMFSPISVRGSTNFERMFILGRKQGFL